MPHLVGLPNTQHSSRPWQVWLDNDPRAPRLVADAVCGPQCPQEGVFAHLRGAVGTALRGACGTVVCCGPAGAGKSHTLLNAHIGEWRTGSEEPAMPRGGRSDHARAA